MNLILIVLVGVLMGAFNFGFFCLGYYVCSKKPAEDSVVVDKTNQKALEDILKWINFSGDKK